MSRMFGNKNDLAERLQQSGNSTSQNVNSILAVMVGASVELAQGENFVGSKNHSKVEDLPHPPALTHMVNILLDQSEVARALIATDKADVLEGYITEMLRLDPPIQGAYREARANETVGSTSLNAGDLVYVDIASANMNVSPGAPRLDGNSHSRLGACICRTVEDQPFPSQGALYPWR